MRVRPYYELPYCMAALSQAAVAVEEREIETVLSRELAATAADGVQSDLKRSSRGCSRRWLRALTTELQWTTRTTRTMLADSSHADAASASDGPTMGRIALVSACRFRGGGP